MSEKWKLKTIDCPGVELNTDERKRAGTTPVRILENGMKMACAPYCPFLSGAICNRNKRKSGAVAECNVQHVSPSVMTLTADWKLHRESLELQQLWGILKRSGFNTDVYYTSIYTELHNLLGTPAQSRTLLQKEQAEEIHKLLVDLQHLIKSFCTIVLNPRTSAGMTNLSTVEVQRFRRKSA